MFPVGITLSMEELVAGEGGQGTRDAAEQILENTFLDGTAGDDFIGVQCYERTVLGPTGPLPPEPGTRLDPDGLRVLAPAWSSTRCAAPPPIPASRCW